MVAVLELSNSVDNRLEKDGMRRRIDYLTNE
jgi:hypothetical protein